MMKKISKVIFISTFFLIVGIFLFNSTPKVKAATTANTLAELRKELASYKAKKEQAEYNKNRTQSEINKSKNEIAASQTEIENNRKKIEEAKVKINELNVEIEDTEEKINNLMRQYEITDGDNNYLEYIFGASSISDFIIRYSISEQLASYNDELITKYEDSIKENEQLQVDLNNREKDLDNKIDSLEAAISSLGVKMSAYSDDALSANKDIESTQQLINEYVKMGCGENEPFSSCVKMQSDTGFLRPLKKGVRTSNFGYRIDPITGKAGSFHSGVDIGGNAEGTSVYSIANGMVGKIVYKYSCGGNMVYIYHTVNGVKYTSTYMHLKSVNVKVGDYVTNQSVIGTVGGWSTSTSHGGYDRCTTGAHLHLSLAKGWYGSTYVSSATYHANLLDAGLSKYVNIPAKGKYFYSRSW